MLAVRTHIYKCADLINLIQYFIFIIYVSFFSERAEVEVYELPRGIGLYKLHPERKTFDEAQVICMEEGANLVIMETYAEAAIVKFLYEEYNNATNDGASDMFVGCDDRAVEGLFVTVKGNLIL